MNDPCKHAVQAQAFLLRLKKTRLSHAQIHDTCNAFLHALRCGRRRRQFSWLRERLRAARAHAAAALAQ